MNRFIKNTLKSVTIFTLMCATSSTAVYAATNAANNSAGGGVTLTNSGDVTITANTMLLVKQVYDTSGNCLASSPSDATCNSGGIAVTVPAGTAIKFVIFIRNDTDIALSDVRFTDTLDETGTGFTYVGSMRYDDSQLDTALLPAIYTAVDSGTAQTDALGGPDDFMSKVGSQIAVGAVAGQANSPVNVTARRTFAIIFDAIKN